MHCCVAALNLPSLPRWIFVLMGAAVAFYVAARAGTAALDPRGTRPGAAAIAHWLPIAAVVLASVKLFPHAAVSIIFASSVACLTLVFGVTLVSLPDYVGGDTPPQSDGTRAWAMVLPAAILALLAGFSGSFKLQHALILAIQGLVALVVWTSRREESPTTQPVLTFRPGIFIAQLLAWFVLTMLGAILAMQALSEMTQRMPRFTGGIIGALILSPALVLPMIGSAMTLIHNEPRGPTDPERMRGSLRAVISICAGCTLLNLCLLLPLTILAWRVIGDPSQPLPYPIATWRIETVAIIVVGAALVPMSAGRWAPRQIEGIALVGGYVAYMLASSTQAMR